FDQLQVQFAHESPRPLVRFSFLGERLLGRTTACNESRYDQGSVLTFVPMRRVLIQVVLPPRRRRAGQQVVHQVVVAHYWPPQRCDWNSITSSSCARCKSIRRSRSSVSAARNDVMVSACDWYSAPA